MNKKAILLLVFSPLVISSCSLMNLSNEDFVPASSSSQTTNPDVEFAVTAAEFTDEQGHLTVHYNCNYSSPFDVAGHSFDHLNIKGVRASEVNSQNNYFTVLSPIINKDLKFEFFDTNGSVYISTRFNGVTPYGEQPIDPIVYPERYSQLYWSDEFNGNTLNQSNWTYEIGNGSGGWGNGEWQYYTNSNDHVSNGCLTIQARKENMYEFNFTSTRIKTQNKVRFTYGYVEAKIALPAGNGMWPAFWMMPNNSVYGGWPHSGEIDIMEARGRLTGESSSALHFSTPDGNHTYLTETKNGHNITEFHTYAVEWEAETIRYFVDDVCYQTITSNQWTTVNAQGSDIAPFDKDFYIILNLAVGGSFDWATPSDSFVSADMKVDYVRVFKK